MADEDPEVDRIQSIDSLAERVDKHESKLDQILSMLSGGGRPASGKPADDSLTPAGRPPSIAEQVRAELARAKEEDKRQADAEASKTEAEQLRERLAKLEETKPDPPQPRRQRVMWGSR